MASASTDRLFVELAHGLQQTGRVDLLGRGHAWLDVTDRPMPSILASRPVRIVSGRGREPAPADERPPYRVPTLADLRRIRPNGLTVVSTFSGAGGSCLGFRLAGFRVLWASEFIEAARETYAVNFPGVPIDARGIRAVKPAEILRAAKLRAGELDVLEGSPPCASFSTAGVRSKHWGQEKVYSDTKQRTDDLFFEYVRILRGLRPKVFVAENVSGLVKGVAKGYFLDVLDALEGAGYAVESRLLDAEWLGVPQARARIIFVGVRKDLDLGPAFPKPLPYRYSVRDALVGLVEPRAVRTFKGTRSADEPAPTVLTHGRRRTHSELTLEELTSFRGLSIEKEWQKLRPGETSDRYFNLVRVKPDGPCPTVTQKAGSHPGTAGVTHWSEPRKFSIGELRRICSFPDDFVLTGTYAQQWERLGRAVPPLMMRAVAETIRDEILARVKP